MLLLIESPSVLVSSEKMSSTRLRELLKLEEPLAAQLLGSYNHSFEEEWKMSVWTSVLWEISAFELGGDFFLMPSQILSAANEAARSASCRVVFSPEAVGSVVRGLLNKRVLLRLRDCAVHVGATLWDSEATSEGLCGRRQLDVKLRLSDSDSQSFPVRVISRLLSLFVSRWDSDGSTYTGDVDIPTLGHDTTSAEHNHAWIRQEFTVPFSAPQPSVAPIEDASEIFVFLPILERLADRFAVDVRHNRLGNPLSRGNGSPSASLERSSHIFKSPERPPSFDATSSSLVADRAVIPPCSSGSRSTAGGTSGEGSCNDRNFPADDARGSDYSIRLALVRYFLEQNMRCDFVSQSHVEVFLWYLTFYAGVVRPFSFSPTRAKEGALQFVKLGVERMLRRGGVGQADSGELMLEVKENDKAAAMEWHAKQQLQRRMTALIHRCDEADAKCRLFLLRENRAAATLWLRQKRRLQDEITHTTHLIFKLEEAAQTRDSTLWMIEVSQVLQSTVAATKSIAADRDHIEAVIDDLEDTMENVQEIRESFTTAARAVDDGALDDELEMLMKEVEAEAKALRDGAADSAATEPLKPPAATVAAIEPLKAPPATVAATEPLKPRPLTVAAIEPLKPPPATVAAIEPVLCPTGAAPPAVHHLNPNTAVVAEESDVAEAAAVSERALRAMVNEAPSPPLDGLVESSSQRQRQSDPSAPLMI